MSKKILRNGLFAAAAMNIGGVLLFSRCFTNDVISDVDPVVMSNFGLLMILFWGLAYGAAAFIPAGIDWLLAVFTMEKFAYGSVWLLWLSENSLADVYARDFFAGIFYSIYGLNDLCFACFFAWAFFWQRRDKSSDLP